MQSVVPMHESNVETNNKIFNFCTGTNWQDITNSFGNLIFIFTDM